MGNIKPTIFAAALAAAAVLGVSSPALAGGARGGATPSSDLLGALAGSALSPHELAATRGEHGVNISQVTNTTNETLNVDAASSGTVNGGSVLDSTTGSAADRIVDSQGIFNQFSNTGSNVIMNGSVAISINTH